MRLKRKALPVLMCLLMVACFACASFDNNTYKTIGVLGVSYDTAMKGLADLKKQGKLNDEQWAQINKAGTEFYVIYHGAIDAFKIYLTVKDKPSQDIVIAALAEAAIRLGRVQEYYNLWKGVK